MSTLERAVEIAAAYHAGQIDKLGKPYILHIMRVVLLCETENEMIVAALHDLLEDTRATEVDLLDYGFSREQVEAVVLLTRKPPYSYAEYITRLSDNKLARKVKIADLRDHLQPPVIESLQARYTTALQLLESIDSV